MIIPWGTIGSIAAGFLIGSGGGGGQTSFPPPPEPEQKESKMPIYIMGTGFVVLLFIVVLMVKR